MSTRLSGPSWSVTPTQREKLTHCPETVLASVRRQFIFVHSLTRTRSSPCHEVFSSVLADLALCLWIRPSEKRQNGRWRSGWRCQVRQGGGALFSIAQMSQNSIDNVLILDAGDDTGTTTAAAANVDVDSEDALQNLINPLRLLLY